MKKMKKLYAILLVVFVFFTAMTTTAFAADVSQDGLEVSLVTDKEAYNQGEQIAATLAVKNTNEFAVKNVTLENLIPDGYVLADGASVTKELESLEPGETAELAVTFVAKGETPTDPTNPTDPTEPDDPSCPGNNDWWKIALPIFGVTGLVGIIIALVQFKKILALILAILIAGSVAIIPHAGAIAGEKIKEIKLETIIKVDSEKITVKSLVTYQKFDLAEDSDNDGLTDEEEEIYGTDKNNPDTDSDGFTDYEEVVLMGTDPLTKNDLNNDTDGDGLVDVQEVRIYGTNMQKSDSDDDGLSDYDEIKIYYTDPLEPDSDGDGAKDGWEIANNYNPLEYDKSFKVAKSSENIEQNVNVTVELECAGEQTDTLKIKETTSTDNALISESIAGYMGVAYDFSIDGTFDEATLTFFYDKSLGNIGENFQPRIYYLNEEIGSFEELPDQTVKNGQVIAKTTHFSTYILLNKVDFDKIWNNEIKPPQYEATNKNIDMIFVVDASGSMSYDSTPKNDSKGIRKDVAKNMVDKFSENDRGAVIKFASSVTLIQGFTNNKVTLKDAIDKIDSYGSTAMYDAISKANKLFISDSSADTEKIMIVLTDGLDNGSSATISNIKKEAVDNGITIYTVGLGSSLDEASLKNVAESTGGKYYHATVADDLYEIYEMIENETIDYITDSNDDNISDYYTELIKNGKLVLSNGSTEFKGIDLGGKADYDGDGILNGDEIVVVEKNGKVYLQYKSSPIKMDTDGDGIHDCKDTAPLKKGLKNGIIGSVQLIADVRGYGHAFIAFTSYINSSIITSGSYYYNYADGSGDKKVHFVNEKIDFSTNELMTFGLLQNGVIHGISGSNSGSAVSGFHINCEIANGGENYYCNRYSIQRELTEDQLDAIVKHFENNDYYILSHHNCSTVACGAWNAAFGKSVSSNGFIGIDTPAKLKDSMEKYGGGQYNVPMKNPVEAWCETCIGNM